MKETTPAVIVATCPRNGSSYHNNLVAGTYQTHLPETRRDWTTEHLQRLPVAQHGIWGTKCFGRYVDLLIRIWPKDVIPLNACRFIHLLREDCVASAVSIVKASQTHCWERLIDDTSPKIPDTAYHYDAQKIKNHVYEQYYGHLRWMAYFKENNITPYQITYTQLFANVTHAYHEICNFLEIPDIKPHITPKYQKQGDAHSQEWIARFKAESPGVPTHIHF